MKVTLATVILAAALVGVQCSWYAGGPALSYGSHVVHAAAPWAGAGGAWGGPWAGAWHGAPAAVDVSAGAWGGYGGHGGYWGVGGGYPGVSLTQGAHHLGGGGGFDYGAGAGYGHGHGHSVYVAKTRGAVHTAPLAGHVHSATALNVAPAPGTH